MTVHVEAGRRHTCPPPVVAAASVVTISVVGLVLPLVIAHHQGALGIPRNDDWSYLRALFHWRDTGKLDFNHWVSMTLLGQLVIARPVVASFGNDITAVQVLTAVMGLVGLLAVLWLGVMTTGRMGVAALIAVAMAASPLWGPLAASFMTDVPAFALTMVACALGVRALRAERTSFPFLVAALVMAFVGFTIRQYVAVPFAGLTFVGALSLRREGSPKRFAAFVGVAAALTVAAIAVLAFWQTIPNIKPFEPTFPTLHSVSTTFNKDVGLFRLAALVLAPLLVFLGPVRIVRRARAMRTPATTFVVVVAGVALVLTALSSPRIAFAGNYVTPNGALSGEVVRGLRPDILPYGGWWLVVAGATLSSLVLLGALVPALVDLERLLRRGEHAPRRESSVLLVEVIVAGYAAAYALASLAGLPIGDRYVLPIVPLVALMLVGRSTPFAESESGTAAPPRGEHRMPAACALVVVGLIGLVFTIDSASFDATRWRVADRGNPRGLESRNRSTAGSSGRISTRPTPNAEPRTASRCGSTRLAGFIRRAWLRTATTGRRSSTRSRWSPSAATPCAHRRIGPESARTQRSRSVPPASMRRASSAAVGGGSRTNESRTRSFPCGTFGLL